MNSNDDISLRLQQIQAQLAKLQESYGNISRIYYNIFFNPNPMNVTLTLYDEDGELKEITVPNRAKDATNKIYTSNGSPNGNLAAPLGSLCFDNISYRLYFKTMSEKNGSTTEGWVELLSKSNFTKDRDYLPAVDADGTYIKNLNANRINAGILAVERGGTGVGELRGLLKGIPAVRDELGKVISPGYITTAEPGVDYTSLQSFTGMICFAPITFAPEGFLICDGAAYRVEHYQDLYELLTRRYDNRGSVYHVKFVWGEDEEVTSYDDTTKSYYRADDPRTGEYDVEWFRVPNLMGYVPRFWSPVPSNTVDSEPNRKILSIQGDAVPNIKGQWVQEITGIPENYFKGAISIVKQDGKPVQVDGKTSSPGGYYDYLIDFNAQNCSSIYSDTATEVTVKNIALLPIIKYAMNGSTYDEYVHVTGSTASDTIDVTSPKAIIKAGPGNDTVIVRPSQTNIYGVSGNNIFKFKAGIGESIVYSQELSAANRGDDTLVFVDSEVADIKFSVENTDLIIHYNDSEGDKVRVSRFLQEPAVSTIKYVLDKDNNNIFSGLTLAEAYSSGAIELEGDGNE